MHVVLAKKIVANKFYRWCDLQLIKKEKRERVTRKERSEGRKGKRGNALEERNEEKTKERGA